MIKGLKEMRITHEGMLDIIRSYLNNCVGRLGDPAMPTKVWQNRETKEFIITFEDEQVKSILPPVEESDER